MAKSWDFFGRAKGHPVKEMAQLRSGNELRNSGL